MPQFFNPHGPVVKKWSDRLPHWFQAGSTYFVTFRLADSIPSRMARDWQREREIWLLHHPEPWTKETESEYFDRFPRQMERWLDQSYGECLLRTPAIARIAGEALQQFDGLRYQQICWVVMPNHVHTVFTALAPHDLGIIVQNWKSYTSHAINRALARKGALWQRDYFDRLIRDEDHLFRVVEYIRKNPQKAKLRATEFLAYDGWNNRAPE